MSNSDDSINGVVISSKFHDCRHSPCWSGRKQVDQPSRRFYDETIKLQEVFLCLRQKQKQ